MSKDKIKMPSDPNKEANELLQRLNTIKQKFNASKGQADGMISDGISMVMQECANLLARVVQEKISLQMRITQLEDDLKEPIKKIPKNMKDLPDAEKEEIEREPSK